jgi:lipopolysaccharide transport system ATP-binding protein
MSDLALSVEGVSKQYKIGVRQEHHDTLRDQFMSGVRFLFRDKGKRPSAVASHVTSSPGHSNTSADTIWALKDVSFEVKQGEVVGIIGRNGAGKSTLLKILSRITEPTKGRIEIYGRVGSLLEVGTGFHPELSGRENIYLNGAVLGMSKAEMSRKFDEIVAFAEIERFLDTPVKRYSSGMYVRLAFAVAAHLETEILIVDEVLAVGDIAFQKKCMWKMESAASGGRTVLFVSHNMAAIENLCQRGIVLVDGRIAFSGSSTEITDYYLRSLPSSGISGTSHSVDLSTAIRVRPGCRRLLKRIELFTDGGLPLTGALRIGGCLTAYVRFELEKPLSNFSAGLGFNNILGQRIFSAHSMFQQAQPAGERAGEQIYVCHIPSLTLTAGQYRMKVSLDIGGEPDVDAIEDAASITIVDTDYYGSGKSPWNGCCVIPHTWSLK